MQSSRKDTFNFHQAEPYRKDVFAAFSKALRDQEWAIHEGAAQALRCYGQNAIPVFVEALKDADPDVRIVAAQGLGGPWIPLGGNGPDRSSGFPVRQDAFVPALGEVLLKDKHAKVRGAAASSLAKTGKPGMILLEAALTAPDSDARRAAVSGLAGMGKPAVPALITALKSGDPDVRSTAIQALGNYGSAARPAVPALAELLKSKDEDLRRDVSFALMRIGDDAGEALPALLLASKSEDQGGKAARDALGRIRKAPRETAPALVLLLQDPEPRIRLKAIEVLCELEESDKECLVSLLDLVKRRDSQVRQESARLLCRYGSAAKDAVPALVEIVRNDNSNSTRTQAINALMAIGPQARPEAIPALIETVRNMAKSEAGLTAIRALGSIGPDAKAALPVLKLAEEEFRQEAERYRALGKMAAVQVATTEQHITYTQEAIKKIGQKE